MSKQQSIQHITLKRQEDCWEATFHGNERVFELFGTYVLPTGFTAQADASMVLAEIRALNPLANVEVTA